MALTRRRRRLARHALDHHQLVRGGLGAQSRSLSIFAASSLAPRVVGRFGARRVITAGMLAATLGMLLLTGVRPDGGYLGTDLVGGVVTSLGMGFSLVPATIVAMQGVARSQSGLASGLLNTSRLMGGVLGLAVLSTIAEARTRSELGVSATRALTEGFDLAFTVGALLCLLGAATAAVLLRPQVSVAIAPAATPAEADQSEALAA